MKNELIKNIENTHWCKSKITGDDAVIERKGKNWYVTVDNSVITVNAVRSRPALCVCSFENRH